MRRGEPPAAVIGRSRATSSRHDDGEAVGLGDRRHAPLVRIPDTPVKHKREAAGSPSPGRSGKVARGQRSRLRLGRSGPAVRRARADAGVPRGRAGPGGLPQPRDAVDGRAAQPDRRHRGDDRRRAARAAARHAADGPRPVGRRQEVRPPAQAGGLRHPHPRDAGRHRALPRLRHHPRHRPRAGPADGRALQDGDAGGGRGSAGPADRGRRHRPPPRAEDRRGVRRAPPRPGRDGVPARPRRLDRVRRADRQALRQGRDQGRPRQPVPAGGRGVGHRLPHRRRDRRAPRHRPRLARSARRRADPRAGRARRGRPRSRARRPRRSPSW